MDMSLDTPVAFFVFNRLKQTRIVFDRIKQARPRELLIVADGPREGRAGEKELCESVREVCVSQIDWPCEVRTNFAESNLGCKIRMSSGLDWVFQTVDRAIILEDDCLPGLSFFEYCQVLLDRFNADERVMQVCGTNVDESATEGRYSYYFSKYGPIWGWASWSRAWKLYDVNMISYRSAAGNDILRDIWEYPGEGEYRETLYRRILSGELDTWDLQWGYAKYVNSGLSIIPAVNLISNIGYGSGSTHTSDVHDPMAERKITELTFPLSHYPFVVRHSKLDRAFHEKMTPENFRNRGTTSV